MIDTMDDFWDMVKRRQGLKLIKLDKEIHLTPEVFVDITYLDVLMDLAVKEQDNYLFMLIDRSTIERQGKIKLKLYVIFKQVLLGITAYVSDS